MGSRAVLQASDSHLDLSRAPYVVYGAKYIDPVSLAPFVVYGAKYVDPVSLALLPGPFWFKMVKETASGAHLDLIRAPYVLYGVKYIDLVSPCPYFQAVCRNYWWSNLLYINNFYPTAFHNTCMSWTWYLVSQSQSLPLRPFLPKWLASKIWI